MKSFHSLLARSVAATAALVFAAAVLAAFVRFTLVMMIAVRRRAKLQRTRQIRCHRCIRIALHARAQLDARACKRLLRTAADAAANEHIRAQRHEHRRQRAMTGAVGVNYTFRCYRAVLDHIQLKLRRMTEMTKDFTVFIRCCNSPIPLPPHVIASLLYAFSPAKSN